MLCHILAVLTRTQPFGLETISTCQISIGRQPQLPNLHQQIRHRHNTGLYYFLGAEEMVDFPTHKGNILDIFVTN